MPPPSKFQALLQLIRFDKPIGTTLLLWPTLWALWIAAGGVPDVDLLIIFVLGTFLMRSAGCVVNDLADRHWDGEVNRTSGRPLVTGTVTPNEARALFLGLLLAAFVLVLFTNPLTVKLSFAAVALASTYPFMKRYTHLPQLVLGAAFSWGIPMAFAAQTNELPNALWLIYLGNLAWTVAYDTKYAMVDREDDLVVGIKSTAILFGRHDRLIVALLQLGFLGLMVAAGQSFHLGAAYYLGLVIAAALCGYHQYLIRERDPDACFKAFLHNNWVGAVIFAGIALDYAI
ncbi:4-hydroxybenzoate octaprenyltransferase [Halioglobus maricola]|uniref:4-hydroxybenzoate octaprenyltransferase n=1 Tax=Halioglobus maricola TaxID=2601894 RepID=A0A5P9NP43_9GAMM|nr:4-hydroxybenzoate octaprenyltransferase [Halioglobus maricola]QFU77643.1 4-hydroxybenzoate octaprenyltransferase [Halioglobus maricola]